MTENGAVEEKRLNLGEQIINLQGREKGASDTSQGHVSFPIT